MEGISYLHKSACRLQALKYEFMNLSLYLPPASNEIYQYPKYIQPCCNPCCKEHQDQIQKFGPGLSVEPAASFVLSHHFQFCIQPGFQQYSELFAVCAFGPRVLDLFQQ